MNKNKIILPSLTTQILPEIDFNILSTGITIKSNDRLSTPRFIPYDQGGRCKECKATEVEVDFVVTKDGVTLYCTRIKGSRFVAFDRPYELPGHCFFRIKNKGRVFNIPHGENPIPKTIQPTSCQTNELCPSIAKQQELDHIYASSIQQEEYEKFFENLNAATAGLPSTSSSVPKKLIKEEDE